MKRKAAVKRSNIEAGVLEQLNSGELESGSLAEGLAIDFRTLLKRVLPSLPSKLVADLQLDMGITTRMASVANQLYIHSQLETFPLLAKHRSDTVRGWAAYLIRSAPELNLEQRLVLVEPLADDPHFGVREWAWLALRPHIAADIELSIELLKPWTQHPSENIRRFAVESTRPRGVWCSHIALLKQRPELGLPLLEDLKADPALYVQNSVGNWLNDAAKSNSLWVRGLCQQWLAMSNVKATRTICKRAQRSIAPASDALSSSKA